MPGRASPHENVRIRVFQLVSSLYREILEEKRSLSAGEEIVLGLFARDSADIFFAQEVLVEGYRIDAIFGSIVFEFKGSEGEFDRGLEKAEEIYLPRLPTARFLVITNYHLWDVYEIVREGGKPLLRPLKVRADLDSARPVLKQLLAEAVPRIPASPDRVERLFTSSSEEKILRPLREALDEALAGAQDLVGPLYEAYKKIVATLYGEASEEFFKDLFVRHTAMQMIVLASLSKALGLAGDPVDLCRGPGLEIDLSLPYLSWWHLALDALEKTGAGVRRAAEDIVARASLIDWRSGGAEDVFRTLYEVLVDPGTRRRIGEYYTPLWVVEMILSRFDLRGRIVLDPFCGSGTFLVAAFHRKVEEGEDPEEALQELVGFDINPLAVAVARAELVLAYFRRAGRSPEKPPRVYHVDTLAVWFGRGSTTAPDLAAIFKAADNFAVRVNLGAAGAGAGPRGIIDFLGRVEKAVARSLRNALAECGLDERCLSERIEHHLGPGLTGFGGLAEAFLEHAREVGLSKRLAQLVRRYRGDSVWASILASVYVSTMLRRIRPHIVVTNPPWIPLLSFRAEYKGGLRSHIMSRAGGLGIRSLGNVDVAVAALSKSLELAGEGVGFVMSREQAFYHRTSMRAGIVATYSILRSFGGHVELVDVDYDAFGHGIYPALVIARRSGGGRVLRVLRLAEGCGKGDSLRSCRPAVKDLGFDYEGYVSPSLAYFSENLDRLARELGVRRIVAEGLYIAGIYGGERRRGAERYAGLVVEDSGYEGGDFLFRLHGISGWLRAPLEWLREHGVRLYTLIYMGEIYPFSVRPLKILLSDKGPGHLRRFLEKALAASQGIGGSDAKKIRGLVKELRQPQKISTLRKGLHYTVYRCNRTFTAAAVDPGELAEDPIIDHHTSALECDTREKALYYAAALNYLAYKAVEKGMGFARSQFARPAMALSVAGLSWNMAGDVEKRIVVELAEKIARTAAWERSLNTQGEALKSLYRRSGEFRRIIEILDGLAENLDEALALVAED